MNRYGHLANCGQLLAGTATPVRDDRLRTSRGGTTTRRGATMQVRSVSWPVAGNRATFRRRLVLLLGAGAMLVAVGVGAATLANDALLRPLLPLAAATLLLMLLWAHGAARVAARRAEVEQSFAGLVVLHHGEAYAVADRPVLGEFATRRHAARAAIERGGWAIIVQAWDRFYLLAAAPAREQRDAPVSFRSRAVADVVPAVRDDVAASA
jgi:hypothetical protein